MHLNQSFIWNSVSYFLCNNIKLMSLNVIVTSHMFIFLEISFIYPFKGRSIFIEVHLRGRNKESGVQPFTRYKWTYKLNIHFLMGVFFYFAERSPSIFDLVQKIENVSGGKGNIFWPISLRRVAIPSPKIVIKPS